MQVEFLHSLCGNQVQLRKYRTASLLQRSGSISFCISAKSSCVAIKQIDNKQFMLRYW